MKHYFIFCLLQRSYLSGTLDKVRAVGVTLPSTSTAARVRKYGREDTGWDFKIVEEMRSIVEEKRLPRANAGLISFDELKIKEGVVYCPHTQTLVGRCHR